MKFGNTTKTFVLLAGLGGLCVAIGGLIGGQSGLIIGLLIGLGIVGVSYWKSDKLALRSARAELVTQAQAPQLYQVVTEIVTAAQLPMPGIAVSPETQPNAFATGRNPQHAVVCVTEGLLQSMPADELKGVLAHEMMHVRHRDILIGAVAAAIATAISFIAQMAMFSAIFGGGNRNRRENPLAVLLVAMLAPISAQLIQMAVSRSREFEADRGAAQLLGTGEPLARALERIEGLSSRIPMKHINPAQAAAWIADPLKAGAATTRDPQQVKMAKLFSTHPSTQERIARLRAMSFSAER